ncbi:MAG: ABC transporter permease subunit [Phycicoccus sp.]
MGRTYTVRVVVLAGCVVVAVAVAGDLLAPHDPTVPLGSPWAGTRPDTPLGTDALGRDVLSRVLAGGRDLALTAAVAGGLASAVGVAGGLFVGWYSGPMQRVATGMTDLLLSVPLLLVAMVLAVSLPGPVAVAAGTVCGGSPLTLRVVADEVGRLRHAGFVEAALGRGESVPSILFREVLPTLTGLVRADVAVRFVMALQLAAAIGLLGLGPAPPAPDWAAMIRENLPGAVLNPLALVAPAAALAVLSLTVAGAGQLARMTSRHGGGR